MPRFALDFHPFWVKACQVFCLILMHSMLAACPVGESGLSIAAEQETSADQAGFIPDKQDLKLETTSYLDSSNGHLLDIINSNRNSNQIPNTQPANWIFGPYLKSGPTFVMGNDLLTEQHDTGWSIAGGVRQPIGPGLGGANVFIDLGGSYLSAFGELTRSVSGEEFDTGPPPPGAGSLGIVDDAFDATLTEVRRAGVHGGLGWYWGPSIDNRCNDPQVRFATILGGRLSSIRGEFDNEPLVLPTPPGDVIRPIYSRKDTAGGLYINTQAILLRRNTDLGIMQWTIDGEFAHDWIDFGGFERGGLGTVSVLFGFLLTR